MDFSRVDMCAHGFTCFIQQGEGGPIKIGFTGDVRKYVANAQVFSPQPVRLLVAISGRESDKRRFHQQFLQYAIRGDWFAASDEILSAIEIELAATRWKSLAGEHALRFGETAWN